MVDFGHGSKFIIQKDSSLEFYSYIDGSRDIIEELNSTDTYIPKIKAYNGIYDKDLKIGKFSIKKEEITQYLSITLRNYLYVVIKKSSNSKINYQYIKGQLLFFSMDYIYSQIPENYSIFSNLEAGQRNPHLYTLAMENT